MKSLLRFLIVLFILSIPFSVSAQRKKKPKGKNYKYRVSSRFKVEENISFYGSLGIANYYGDLCDNFECIQLRPTLGAGFMYRFSKHFTSKSELNYLRLASKDVWPERNLSFRSGNIEIYTSLMYDYYAFTKNIRKRRFLSPYIFAGVGLASYNPRAELDGKWYTLRDLKTEGISYGFITPIIPFGFGFKIKHSRNWDFMIEGGYRLAFTDYIDDVSAFSFKKQNEFTSHEAASLSNRTKQGDDFLGYRGNPKRNDGYGIISIKARYTIASKNTFKNKYTEQHRKVF